MECLKQIVGVTLSDCTCIINGITGDALTALRVSTSKLYLDDLPGGVHLKALTNADACRTMGAMAISARDNAIKTLEADMVVALNNKYVKSNKNFTGQIGRMSYAGSLGVTRPWQGLRIRPVDFSDAVLKVTRVAIIVNSVSTFNIRVLKVPYGSTMGTQVAEFPVTTVANGYVYVSTMTGDIPLTLPFVDQGEQFEYWFVYDRTEGGGAVVPKDTGVQCTSCNQTEFMNLSSFVNVQGIEVDTLGTLNNAKVDGFSHGLILDATIKCDTTKLFCREYSENDAVAVVMAWATLFKAGELLIEDVLKQPDVNRYTTMAREYLWGKRNHFRKEYETRVTYLAATVDVTASNCYVCREQPNQPFMAGIFS